MFVLYGAGRADGRPIDGARSRLFPRRSGCSGRHDRSPSIVAVTPFTEKSANLSIAPSRRPNKGQTHLEPVDLRRETGGSGWRFCRRRIFPLTLPGFFDTINYNVFHNRIRRIARLLSRAGGGTSPMKPGNRRRPGKASHGAKSCRSVPLLRDERGCVPTAEAFLVRGRLSFMNKGAKPVTVRPT